MARRGRTKDTIIQELIWAEGLDNPFESLARSRRLRRLPKEDLERFLDEENAKIRETITPEMRAAYAAVVAEQHVMREPVYRQIPSEDRLWMVKHHLMRYHQSRESYTFTTYGISVFQSLQSLPE